MPKFFLRFERSTARLSCLLYTKQDTTTYVLMYQYSSPKWDRSVGVVQLYLCVKDVASRESVVTGRTVTVGPFLDYCMESPERSR